MTKKDIPTKTVERLVLYRRLLSGLQKKGLKHLYSHQLAEFTCNTPAQIRRDIMMVGYVASSRKGYCIDELIEKIDETLLIPQQKKIALIGLGNLGNAVLSYFNSQHSTLTISAAFDIDKSKVNKRIAQCSCYHISELEKVLKTEGIDLAIIAVPGKYAQETADELIKAGVVGFINFAPVPLKLPDSIYAERIDITTTIEKVAYFTNIKKSGSLSS
jgi:redox-sensing transcriptional repressor